MTNDRKPRSSLPVIAGIAVAALAIVIAMLLGLVCLGLMTGRLADTKVLPGNKLPPRISRTVSASAGLMAGERMGMSDLLLKLEAVSLGKKVNGFV